MNDNTCNPGLSQMAGNSDMKDQLLQAADELHSVAMTIRLIAEQMKDNGHGQTR